RLGSRRVDDLGPLAVALLAVALDLGLAGLQLMLAAPDLLLGPGELDRRCILGVPLERVGQLRCRAAEMQRVNPDGAGRGLDARRPACGLEDPQLGLEL